VTIPYKEKVISYITELGRYARRIGAVNVIRIEENGDLTGFNSDYYGFRISLEKWLGSSLARGNALILGTGGASKAVTAVLEDANISYKKVSRSQGKGDLTYHSFIDDPELILDYPLIINTTPTGMYPHENEAPNLPYHMMNEQFYLYDLIYNPEKTLFLQMGEKRGANIKNGLEMLILQAEKSWELWNK
jgi:shikimate dehydrogenase